VEVHLGAVGKTWPVVEGSEELAPLSEREMMFLVSCGVWVGVTAWYVAADRRADDMRYSRGKRSCGESR
jgi:hypothetical protein